ncbi:MAG: UDP-glucose 4-epimerase GalE [Phycicoccus sp.]|nr:UDP-glucose 4-epimerase GalE [Phycicoccus sp.]NMM34025.1 UDP-glucose 4-epimerase GalE [Phycicoccus sp.]
MRVLVTGGAGYIGSHTVIQLIAAGHDVLIVDSFANSKPTVISRLEAITGKPLLVYAFDLRDTDKTDDLFAREQIDAVIHFAGHKAVGESVQKPLEYYENNLNSTLVLAGVMARHAVTKLVFSSSATVYGASAPVPMTEDLPTSATNPYGWTKVMIEQILRDVAVAQPEWRIALLRYFNPVGAHASGTIGEDPSDIPNNLVPYLSQVAVGRREKLQIFGDDYDTPDGTPLRDYIHVEDLAAGHIAALSKLATTESPVSTWNLGTGVGTSVLDVLHAFERAVGRALPYEIVGRRAGDIAASYADPHRANAELGWTATRTIDDMCADSWRWQSQNPNGYPDV